MGGFENLNRGFESSKMFRRNHGFVAVAVQLLIVCSFWERSLAVNSRESYARFYQLQGRDSRRFLADDDTVDPFCKKVYQAQNFDTCAKVRASQNITQEELQQLNTGLNCKTLMQGQKVCVQGIPADCQRTITIPQGPPPNASYSSCANVANAEHLSAEGFRVLNPGISCPEDNPSANKSNLTWSETQVVCVVPGLGNIFVEYLGAGGPSKNIAFDSLTPIAQSYSSIVYRLVLSFAIDADSEGNSKNGVFAPYWNPALTPEEARVFKAGAPGAQLFVSLGGATQFISDKNISKPVIWENPSNADQWIANAVASLTEIVSNYSIDGLDIDYEHFSGQTSPGSNFSYCIGTLIKQLKVNNTIGLASIAPSDSTAPEYRTLMDEYGAFIDYVNYQFFQSNLTTIQAYKVKFSQTALDFAPWKLLASARIPGVNVTGVTGDLFQQTVDQLWHERGIPGVMLWQADDSSSTNFETEKALLTLLTAESPGTDGTPAPAPSPLVPTPGGPAPNPVPGNTPGAAPTGLIGSSLWSSRQLIGLLTTTVLAAVFLT